MSSWNQAFLSILLATIFTNVSCTLFSTTTGTSTITGFDVDVDIGTIETTVTVSVAFSQFQVWHGIGFGSTAMTGTYALIAEFNGAGLDYSIWLLGKNDGTGKPSEQYVGTEYDAAALLWTEQSIDTSVNPIIITLTRPNTATNAEPNFNPNDLTLQMIHAYGTGQFFIQANGHGTNTNRVFDTYDAITSSPTTTIPTTSIPTTNTPTTNTPTTTTPTTTMPTTATPTTNMPTTTVPTTTMPTTMEPTTNMPTTTIPTTSVPTEVNATTGVPTTSTPTIQTTIIYTTSTPTTTTPTTTAPTTSEPTIAPSITTISPTTSAPTAPTTLNPTQLPTYIPTLIPTSLPTYIPTMEPTTHEPTIPITTQEAIIPTKKKYKSGVQGMIEKGQDWVNNDATQVELFMVCGIFGAMLVCCLCFWYCGQYQKTRKLRKKLIPQEQKEARNNKNKNKKYEDVPEAEVIEPESLQHNNSEELGIAIAAGDNSIPPPPKDTHNNIPIEIENKLEESLSVNESIPAAEPIPIAPPPPSEPVPQDILNEHRERAATQLKKKKGIELQKLQRIHSTSNVSEKSITISDAISDNDNDKISDAIIPLANKRNNNDPALALLSSDNVIVMAKHDTIDDNIKEKKRDDIALEMITITPAKNDNENNEQPVLNDIEAEFKALASKMDDNDDGDILQEVNKTKLGQDKKVEIDPFASLDMSNNPLDSLFDNKVTPQVIEKKDNDNDKDKDKDSEAMGVLGGLLSANPEFGDKDNIFGGTGDTAADAILNSGATSNMVDLQKYTNVKDSIPIDYDKLTKISDTDVYKVVSVQETVIVDHGDGNIQQIIDKKDINHELQELDDILNDNNVNANNVKIIDEEIVNNNNNKYDAALMLLAGGNGDNDKKEHDPFADLNVASPMDDIMKTDIDVVVHKKEDDPFAELNMGSPMDDIMNAAKDNNNDNDVDKKEDDLFADLNTGSPLDNIMNAANEDDDSTDSSSDAEDDMNMMKEDNKYNNMVPVIGNKTVDLDNLMGGNDDNDDNVESKQEDDNEDDNDNEESMGSEIIHDTPRHSEIVHEKLDPQVFGNGDDSSSESDEYSNATDPNAY